MHNVPVCIHASKVHLTQLLRENKKNTGEKEGGKADRLKTESRAGFTIPKLHT